MALSVPPGSPIENVTPQNSPNFELKPSTDPLFNGGGPGLADIAQKSLADCFILSSLIAILHRPNGALFISNMMKEIGPGEVIVRLYGAEDKPLYLKVKRCRITSNSANVSPRTCCWPDVIEACMAIFKMKKDDALDARDPSASLDNLHLGQAKHALLHLLGFEPISDTLTDVRDLSNPEGNFGYAFLKIVLNPDQAPDKDYCNEIITDAFGNYATLWKTWTLDNGGALDQFLQQRSPTKFAAQSMAMKSNVFADFLKTVPREFQGGLKKIARKYQLVQGRRLEPLYTAIEDEFYDTINTRTLDGCPVVITSRASVGRTPAVASQTVTDEHKGMLGGHCYAVEKARKDENGRKWIYITNPWGRYVRDYDQHTGQTRVAENIDGMGAGRFMLSLHDLMKKFESVTYVQKPVPPV